jgi:hypothetical protein
MLGTVLLVTALAVLLLSMTLADLAPGLLPEGEAGRVVRLP